MESSYYVLLLLSLIIALWIALSLLRHFKNRKIVFLLLSFILLWVFLLVREPYSDMISYERYFQSINIADPKGAFDKGWELLFKALLFGIKIITDDHFVMMGIVSFITLVGPFLFIKRYSSNYFLSLIMFITVGSFYMQFFILRQAIALSIFLAVFHFIGEKKMIKYCLGVVIAALFHKTAFILLLLFPLVNVPPSKYKNIAIALSVLIVLIFSSQITSSLMTSFYDEYADRVVFGSGIWLFCLYVFMYVVYILLGRKLRFKEDSSIEKGTWFTIILQFFAIQNGIFCRLANYTRDSFCIMIPNLSQKLEGKDRMLFSLIIVIVCICFVLATDVFVGYNIIE